LTLHSFFTSKLEKPVKTQISIVKINEEEYIMQWENQDILNFDIINEVTITCPHERLRALNTDKDGCLSTEESSSVMFYVKEGGRIIRVKD
jgi:hypothetical protein